MLARMVFSFLGILISAVFGISFVIQGRVLETIICISLTLNCILIGELIENRKQLQKEIREEKQDE